MACPDDNCNRCSKPPGTETEMIPPGPAQVYVPFTSVPSVTLSQADEDAFNEVCNQVQSQVETDNAKYFSAQPAGSIILAGILSSVIIQIVASLIMHCFQRIYDRIQKGKQPRFVDRKILQYVAWKATPKDKRKEYGPLAADAAIDIVTALSEEKLKQLHSHVVKAQAAGKLTVA
jgi:hypothetical protein